MNEDQKATQKMSDFSGILSDPDTLNRVENAIKKLGILEDEGEEKEGENPRKNEENTPSQNGGEILSLLTSLGGEKSQKSSKETALLLAIRPYLSPRRQELIDYFLKMSQFGDLFKKLM